MSTSHLAVLDQLAAIQDQAAAETPDLNTIGLLADQALQWVDDLLASLIVYADPDSDADVANAVANCHGQGGDLRWSGLRALYTGSDGVTLVDVTWVVNGHPGLFVDGEDAAIAASPEGEELLAAWRWDAAHPVAAVLRDQVCPWFRPFGLRFLVTVLVAVVAGLTTGVLIFV